jgi:hypothetical protein
MTIDKTISTLKAKYNRQAATQAIKTTLHNLTNLETNLRFDARIALEIGLPAKTQRLLQEAANVREAINLIKTHAVPQD